MMKPSRFLKEIESAYTEVMELEQRLPHLAVGEVRPELTEGGKSRALPSVEEVMDKGVIAD